MRTLLARPIPSRAAILGLSLACAMAVLAYGYARGDAQRRVVVGELAPQAELGHAGSASCGDCHPAQTRNWRSSQHARAMQPATSPNVLGDFRDARAEHLGSRARFRQEDGRFLVETESKDGKPASFEVEYTFGVEPLQQYLTRFPDGRLQTLPYAWVTTPETSGGQRWIISTPTRRFRLTTRCTGLAASKTGTSCVRIAIRPPCARDTIPTRSALQRPFPR